MKPKKYTLAEAQEAAAKLFLFPDNPDESDLEFLKSDLVGQLLEGKWPTAFRWTSLGGTKPNGQ
jgi:hypothetical protein